MAIKEIKREWSPCQLDYVKTYLLHSEADVKDLPKCCIGSKATVSETDNEYFCTADGWKLSTELEGGSGGASGGNTGGNTGGGGVFIVKPINIEQGSLVDVLFSYEADLDKPFEEAVAAFQSGQQVVLEATNLMGMGETMQIPLVAVSDAVSYFTAFVGGVVIVGEYSEYLHIHGTAIV